MAQLPTWTVTVGASAYASSKSMLAVMNGVLSTANIYIYRCHWFNNGTAAVTGVLTTYQVQRIISMSAGTAETPVKHNTGSSALNANTTAASGGTIVSSDVFRRGVLSNDEPTVSGSSMDEWELLVPYATIWDAGYGDTTIQPLACIALTAQGISLTHTGATAVGSADLEIEFVNN